MPSETQIHPDETSVMGISGGPDSLCLLHALHALGYKLLAVHINHQLRPEAGAEALMVERFAAEMGVEFLSRQVDVTSYAEEQSISIEEAARTLRYQVLFEQAEKYGACAVIVAHNADDQVETLLMHLLRGTGLAGLRGMEYRSLPNAWSQHIPLVRPLLSTWREEVLNYLAEHQLSYISDQSNFDTVFFRNRLRHELLPILEKYNPRVRENLLRMSQINKEDYAVIQRQVDDAWEANLRKRGPGFVAFHLTGYQELLPAIQRYLLRRAFAYHLPSLRDIDFDSIERAVKFLRDGRTQGQIDLIAGLRLLKEGESFWLATWQADLPASDFPAIPGGEVWTLNVPSTISLNDGWKIQAIEAKTTPQVIQGNQAIDPFQAWLDVDELSLPLAIRNRKRGDRFQPLGMDGHSLKVSDLMVNEKIPVRVRPTWPLVCSGETIVWIPGCRQSQLGRIQPGSRHIAHLMLKKASAS